MFWESDLALDLVKLQQEVKVLKETIKDLEAKLIPPPPPQPVIDSPEPEGPPASPKDGMIFPEPPSLGTGRKDF